MDDLIRRQDAIEAVRYLIYDRQEKGAKPFKWWFIKQRLNAIPSAKLPKGDLISRADALMELNGACSNWHDDAKVAEIIHALPSADAVHKPDYSYEADMVRRLKEALSAEAETVHIETYRELYEKYVELKHASAEAVQVVRCKDCRYYDKYPTWSACTYWSGDPYEQATVDDNDFCSYGERREPCD